MKNISFAQHLEFLKISKIRQIMNSAPKDAINLGLGEIQFPLHDSLKRKAEQIIENENLFYTTNAGILELREKISKYYDLYFKENVCITAGAEEAIFASLFAYLNPGDEVLIADPGFVAYKTIIRMLKAKPVSFKLDPDDFHFDLNEFKSKITKKTKIVLLNNPINPTGTAYSSHDLKQISELCNERNILLSVDEVYRELYIEDKPQSILEINPNSLSISSLSKSHGMSGWRLGWVASASSELIEPIIKVHQYICTCANTLAQKLAISAFSPDGKIVLESILNRLADNRKIVQKYFPANYLLPNKCHPYFFVQVKNDIEIIEKILQQKVIVIPGSVFGRNGENWIRLNYGIESDLLETGIKRILEII
ncbi:MAG: pyridoxal phosphate-dependent aminotransferase [Candidatus Cloacimonetes bacterium]|nr:pyridoxal phosphate-dependent aminotransferase [Candidatus Cloacimonadota bacterium]MCF7814644.1 pyridoxal phosphate-dependent aminotransferase [Candidatus Cloacimonadota bacterium]MCF7869111.1 pyridoxal phosphate-dependent aminotransferase [Candidatus Cloacimonadota bacterium]MCF7884526.1 pyridoxal phosphate-dependent aminotransferase [Candidatus Cloacimonadota bacterium]